MEYLTADAARAITKANVEPPKIETYVDVIDRQIRQTAERGEASITLWSALVECFAPTIRLDQAQREAIEAHYRHLGFTWEDHTAVMHGYILLSWS